MTKFLTFAGFAVAGLVAGYLVQANIQSLGGVYSQTIQNFDQGGLHIGPNGSTINELKATTCNFLGMDVSHAATSTKPYDCAVTGLASGDVVMAQIASSSPTAGQTTIGWLIRSCHASTTADYLTCDWFNATGASSVPSAVANDRIGSSTNVWYMDN